MKAIAHSKRFDRKISIGVLLSFLTAACSNIGPATVPRDRIEYVDAIGTSWEQQTLLNIVKLRYGHAPTFLAITQVVAGYQFQTTAGATLAASTFNPVTNTFGLAGTGTAQGQYTDRPTIIYSPLTGVDFLQKLMTPIPPSTILFILQSGYDAEVAGRLSVKLRSAFPRSTSAFSQSISILQIPTNWRLEVSITFASV